MKNRHAIIDAKTGLVRNVVIWEGASWLPPKDHFVVHDCDGQIGDYWHQDSDVFYTANMKRRFRDAEGKVGEADLSDDEQKVVAPVLEKVFAKK